MKVRSEGRREGERRRGMTSEWHEWAKGGPGKGADRLVT